jgi:PadR family transcriptional regulator, regulatory protein PadR
LAIITVFSPQIIKRTFTLFFVVAPTETIADHPGEGVTNPDTQARLTAGVGWVPREAERNSRDKFIPFPERLDTPFSARYHQFAMKTKEHLLDGVPELLVLRLLAHNEMYGYQLVSEIQRRSNGAFEFGEGCIYPVLHRLVMQRQLLERQQEVGGRTRRYYRLSAAGKKRLAVLENTWQQVSAAITACGTEVLHA